VEEWANRFSGTDSSAAVSLAARRFQRSYLEYARDGGSRKLAHLLAAVTDLELAVSRSGRAREAGPVRRPPPAAKFLAVLATERTVKRLQALRVAAGLASIAGLGADGKYRTLRQLLLPLDKNGRWSQSPIVPGFGVRPLPAVLADVLIWRCRTAPAEGGEGTLRGVPSFRTGILVPADDLHDFAAERLDDKDVGLYLRACLALNWWRVHPDDWLPTEPSIPVPTLSVLQPLAAGLSPGGAVEEVEFALNPGWAARLVVGQIPEVHAEAASRLRQAGWEAVPAPHGRSPETGTRIAAALVPRCLQPIRQVLPAVAIRIKSQEQS
jgi:CRISPR-associated protein Csx17